MRVEQHGDAAAAEVLEQHAHGAAPDRVERRGRLVEQQQARLADERLRDAESLLHALRHAVDAPVGGVGERDELEQPLALRSTAARAGEPLVQLEHLVRRVPAGEAEELCEVAERRARGTRARPRACDLGRAARLAHEPDRDLHERRLAGAVRAEQAEQLALADLEIDALERLHRAVAFRETADGESSSHSPSVSAVVWRHATRLHGRSCRRRGRAPRRRSVAHEAQSHEEAGVSRGLRLHGRRSEPHFLGWRNEVDPDALFASGKAWGVTVRRVAAATS